MSHRLIRLVVASLAGVALLYIASPASAQPTTPPTENRSRGEEIRNMKIAFFTEALQLTPEQSQQFWPVYNQYWSKLREIGHRRRNLFKSFKETKATDVQLRELLSIMDAERLATATYIEQFKEVLPIDKVARVFVADEDFKNYLIRQAAGGGPR